MIAEASDAQGAPSRALSVAVASGKGGTGKTLVSVGLAALASLRGWRVTLADCDVEAPNDHLFLSSQLADTQPVFVPVAEVDSSLCTACGTCRTVCSYGAPRILGPSAMIFEEMCHGCGLCVSTCPSGAIHEVPRHVGEVAAGRVDAFDSLELVTGTLDIGQVKTPAVIRSTRARAERSRAELTVLDAPPGVACSAVASVHGADLLVLVTEDTPFGRHDLELAYRLGSDLDIPMAIVVNRDASPVNGAQDDSQSVDALARAWGVPVVARIAFDRRVAETYARGENAALELESVRTALERVLDWVESAGTDITTRGESCGEILR